MCRIMKQFSETMVVNILTRSDKEEIIRLQREVNQLKQHSHSLENNIKENQKNERACQTRIMKLREQCNRICNVRITWSIKSLK